MFNEDGNAFNMFVGLHGNTRQSLEQMWSLLVPSKQRRQRLKRQTQVFKLEVRKPIADIMVDLHSRFYARYLRHFIQSSHFHPPGLLVTTRCQEVSAPTRQEIVSAFT